MRIEPGAGEGTLMIYIEPTPYVMALIRQVVSRSDTPIDALFITSNESQPWDLSLEGVPAVYLPRGNLAACREIAKRLSSGKYRMVHLAGWGHPVLLAALIAARMRGLRVAVETDTLLPPARQWPKRVAKALLYPTMLGMPTVFLPGGTRQKRYLQHYGVPESRIVIAQMTVDVVAIGNDVAAISSDARQVLRVSMGIDPKACIFLFVGRLEPEKGISVLLEAFSQMAARRDNVSLVIVGDGKLRGAVAMARTESERIHWPGRLDGEALLNIYAAADIFVLPSLFEPWGLVVNEAMAAGLPVIATERVGCVDDLVDDGRTGIVVDAENSSALAEAMVRLADDAALRMAMGAAARRKIAGWTIETEAAIVVGAWRQALRT